MPVKVYVRTHVKITRQWKSTLRLMTDFLFQDSIVGVNELSLNDKVDERSTND